MAPVTLTPAPKALRAVFWSERDGTIYAVAPLFLAVWVDDDKAIRFDGVTLGDDHRISLCDDFSNFLGFVQEGEGEPNWKELARAKKLLVKEEAPLPTADFPQSPPLYHFTCIVAGEKTTVSVPLGATLSDVRHKALVQTRNNDTPENIWEIRSYPGRLLHSSLVLSREHVSVNQRLVIDGDTRLSITLRPGWGG